MAKYKVDGEFYPKKLSPEEIEEKKAVLGSFALSSFGDEVYLLPGGVLTGKAGLAIWLQAMKDRWSHES